jgi:hypothetical protein
LGIGDWGLGIGPNPQSPIIYEGYSLYDNIIESFLIRFTHTFEEYNNLLLSNRKTIEDFLNKECVNLDSENRKKEIISDKRNKLKIWLENEYHPRVIQSDFLRELETFKNEESVKKTLIFSKFENLVYYCKKIQNFVLEDIGEDFNTKDLFTRFYDILDKLIDKFNINL